MNKELPSKEPRKFDVVLQLVKGSLSKVEYSNTIYILVDKPTVFSAESSPNNQKTVEEIMTRIPDTSWGVVNESSAMVIYSFRVNKLFNIHAILDELISELKKSNLVVGKS